MARDLARFCLKSSNTSSDRLGIRNTLVVVLDPVRSLFLVGTTQFADQNDSFRVIVRLEDLQRVYEIGTSNDITTHANAQTLPKAGSCERPYRLV